MAYINCPRYTTQFTDTNTNIITQLCQFVESLCTLREMGFDVENTNILKILRKNNGELERTITELMDSSF